MATVAPCEPARLRHGAERALQLVRHVPVREPGRVAHEHVHPPIGPREPHRPGEVANVVPPDVVPALVVEPAQRGEGGGDRWLVLLGDGEAPEDGCQRGHVAGRARLRRQIGERRHQPVKARGVGEQVLGEAELGREELGLVGRGDDEVVLGEQVDALAPLHAVAQVDGDRDRPALGTDQALAPDREKVGDAGERHRHGVQVDAEDVVRHAGQRASQRPAGCLGGRQVAAHGVEEECPRTAGRVEHALLERRLDGLGHHVLGEPVGRVVLAEPLACLDADDRLVQHLEDVVVDDAPVEPREPPRQRADVGLAAGDLERPVEEVLLDDAEDLRRLEALAAQQGRRDERGDVEAEDGVGDHLRRVDQQGVLEEERVRVLELGPEGGPQELRPELALEPDRRILSVFGVEGRQRGAVQRVRGAARAEPPAHLLRRGHHALRRREHALEPDKKGVDVGAGGGDGLRRHLGECVVAVVVRPPFGAVGQHAHVALASGASPRGHVPGELLLGVRSDPAAAEVALHLDDGVADLDVDAATIADGRLQADDLVPVEAELRAEQELPHVGLHRRLAARPVAAGQPREQLAEIDRREGLHGRSIDVSPRPL